MLGSSQPDMAAIVPSGLRATVENARPKLPASTDQSLAGSRHPMIIACPSAIDASLRASALKPVQT